MSGTGRNVVLDELFRLQGEAWKLRRDLEAAVEQGNAFVAAAEAERDEALVAEVERLRGIVQRVEDVAPRIRDDRKGVAEGWAWAVREVRGLLSTALVGDAQDTEGQ